MYRQLIHPSFYVIGISMKFSVEKRLCVPKAESRSTAIGEKRILRLRIPVGEKRILWLRIPVGEKRILLLRRLRSWENVPGHICSCFSGKSLCADLNAILAGNFRKIRLKRGCDVGYGMLV